MTSESPIDAKEAARMLGVVPRTVVRLVEKGELTGFQVGDVWRFYRKDIEEYIQRKIEQAKRRGELTERDEEEDKL